MLCLSINMYMAAIFCLLATLSQVKAESELTGKVVVVTGGARGIGRAIVDNCLQNDAQVIFVDKNLTQGLRTESEFKSKYGVKKIWFIHGDVITDLNRVFKIIFKIVRYVDILVSNAGILNEYDPELTILTNLLAPAMWANKFYQVMSKAKGGKGGIIMNIASIDGYYRDPFMWNYKTTKFGIIGLSVGLGHEWNFMYSGVKIFALCPNYTYTDMTEQQMVIDEQVDIFNKFKDVGFTRQTADAVGKAAVTLLNTATTGIVYTVSAGEISISPDSTNVTAAYLLSLK